MCTLHTLKMGKAFGLYIWNSTVRPNQPFWWGVLHPLWVPSPQTYIWCVQSDGNYPHQLIIILTLDLCCWMVWGQHWLVVLLPILSLIASSGKVIDLIYFLCVFNILYSVENSHNYWILWLWEYQDQCNVPNPLPCPHPGNNLMVYPPHHLPHFDYCWD